MKKQIKIEVKDLIDKKLNRQQLIDSIKIADWLSPLMRTRTAAILEELQNVPEPEQAAVKFMWGWLLNAEGLSSNNRHVDFVPYEEVIYNKMSARFNGRSEDRFTPKNGF